ncbi:MAG: AAA family ATPase [Candidatus Omnitrophica bacterium]|nr:AAA family ATPase [Candidatus Omnitrophota bacterium]MBU1038252.1 AAA family ATPase [Candidatus Omnitrophota bacterium]MBU1809384.1 AAA family ATPase [Candidatus Omnitrophota bacterium]
MSYYKILGLDKEPFSTSPDPKFFYESKEHKSVLYRLRVAIELRRGLSVVLGDVGTGKTTLSRRLSQLLVLDPTLMMTMILNPVYESELQFLSDLAERFHIKVALAPGDEPTVLGYLKAIEKFLFDKGVEGNRTIVILIDESQKLNLSSLEVLRSLLNYETNEFKILQVILMGQMELLPRISGINNLWDRISLKYVINPLEENEVREMIDFRLKEAGYVSRYPIFTDNSIRAIYNYTQGYPRKIAMLCHDALEYLVMYKREMIDKEVIDDLIRNDVQPVNV